MLEEALISACRLFKDALAQGLCNRYALIGGLAVSARGFPRATQDIDFLVDVPDAKCAELASFLGGTFRAPDIGDPLAGVFVANSPSGVSIQAIRLGPKLTDASLSDVSEVELCGASIPIVGIRGLILLKLFAGGAHDLSDVIRLLEINEMSTESLAELRAFVEAFGLGGRLDTAVSSKCS
jgi:hypothetical protein